MVDVVYFLMFDSGMASWVLGAKDLADSMALVYFDFSWCFLAGSTGSLFGLCGTFVGYAYAGWEFGSLILERQPHWLLLVCLTIPSRPPRPVIKSTRPGRCTLLSTTGS